MFTRSNVVLLSFLIVSVFTEESVFEECPLVLNINRSIRNLGFHRNIDYSFEVLSSEELKECKVCFKQTIPSGLFVNQDQIWELVRLGKLAAHVDGPVDVETPADKSTSHNVYIFAEFDEGPNVYNASVTLPIHARYHTAKKDGGFEQAFLPLPEVYFSCKLMPPQCQNVEFQGQPDLSLCPVVPDGTTYRLAKYTIESGANSSEIAIPVGNSSNYEIVQIFTFIVTWAGSHFIYYTILNNKPRDAIS